MRRGRWLWPAFAVGAAIVLAAMAWLTFLERSLMANDLAMRESARVDAAARSSLWRLDSSLAGLIASEQEGQPDADEGAEGGRMPSLGRIYIERTGDHSMHTVSRGEVIHEPGLANEALRAASRLGLQLTQQPAQPVRVLEGLAITQGDFQQRYNNANAILQGPQQEVTEAAAAQRSPMQPAWLSGDRLGLLRVLERSHGSRVLEAEVVDARALERTALATIADLLPDASLVRCDDPARASYPLAVLPLALVPGRLPPFHPGDANAIEATIGAAWACALGAIGAMAALLAGAKSLGDRQAAFASAVTHELRTPITSLRLYADMLADGMVVEPARRGEYLATIRAESERLGRLVENVLAWARLERAREGAVVGRTTLGHLVSACQERLARRAAEAGMTLEVELGACGEAAVSAHPGMVEQVLFNLVDNACKYASGAQDRRICVRAAQRDGRNALVVSDRGPGIDAATCPRLFRAFERSAAQAARSAPGVGLGLALSRRLARSMRGDLVLAGSEGGAAFALELPAA